MVSELEGSELVVSLKFVAEQLLGSAEQLVELCEL